MSGNLSALLRLLLVTDDHLLGANPVERCHAAVAGGATAVELRLKHVTDADLLALARALVRELPVPVLVNDRLDVALAAGAVGVHLGANDLPPTLARRIVPAGFIIGASVGSSAEAARAEAADYWGIGSFRTSSTKRDAGDALGLDGARALLALAGDRPCVMIGGVVPEDVAAIRGAGFAGVAVASGIMAADDITAAARRYVG